MAIRHPTIVQIKTQDVALLRLFDVATREFIPLFGAKYFTESTSFVVQSGNLDADIILKELLKIEEKRPAPTLRLSAAEFSDDELMAELRRRMLAKFQEVKPPYKPSLLELVSKS